MKRPEAQPFRRLSVCRSDKPSHKDSSVKVNLLCLDQSTWRKIWSVGQWAKLLRLGPGELFDKQHGGIFSLLGKLFGLGPGELQKQMSDPIKQQMIMQRGGFPWALAGLSLLPALLGKGEEDRIRNQMQMTRDPIMQRGGLAIPPALISKGLSLLKQIGIPTALGALASPGDNIVDEIFGDGKPRRNKALRTKKGAPRMKHKGKTFHKLGTKLATSTGLQIKKFFKKKKTR